MDGSDDLYKDYDDGDFQSRRCRGGGFRILNAQMLFN